MRSSALEALDAVNFPCGVQLYTHHWGDDTRFIVADVEVKSNALFSWWWVDTKQKQVLSFSMFAYAEEGCVRGEG